MRTLATDSLLSDPSGLWLEDSTSAEPTEADPLSQALPWLVRHLGVAAAVEAVVGPVDGSAGLEVPGSDQILPALRRIGFDARMAKRSLAELQASDLPAVLLLRDGDACVLTRRHTDDDGQTMCTVVMPGAQTLELLASDEDIAAEYSGVALLVSRPPPPVRVAGRSPFGQARGQSGGLSALAAAIQSASQAMSLVDQGQAPSAQAVAADTVPLSAGLQDQAARLALPDAGALAAAGHLDRPSWAIADAGALLAPQVDGQADAAVVLELSFLKASSPAGRSRLRFAAWRLRCQHGLAQTGALGSALLHTLGSGLRRLSPGLGLLTWPRRTAASSSSARAWAGTAAPVLHALGRALGLRQAMAGPDLDPASMRTGWAQALTPASLGGLPLWLSMSAVCLLIGTPLAWAQMVSLSSLQAAATLAPARWREALAADQDRAVSAMAMQRLAQAERDAAAAERAAERVAERAAERATEPAVEPVAAQLSPQLSPPAPSLVAPQAAESPAAAADLAQDAAAERAQAAAASRPAAGRTRSVPRRAPRAH